jgi:hypothetical protein
VKVGIAPGTTGGPLSQRPQPPLVSWQSLLPTLIPLRLLATPTAPSPLMPFTMPSSVLSAVPRMVPSFRYTRIGCNEDGGNGSAQDRGRVGDMGDGGADNAALQGRGVGSSLAVDSAAVVPIRSFADSGKGGGSRRINVSLHHCRLKVSGAVIYFMNE